MLGDLGVEGEKIRDREEGRAKPERAEDAQRASGSAPEAEPDRSGAREQTAEGEEFVAGIFPPGRGAAVDAGLGKCALHVELAGPGEQPRVVAERAKHEQHTLVERRGRTAGHRRAKLRQRVERAIRDEENQCPGHRAHFDPPRPRRLEKQRVQSEYREPEQGDFFGAKRQEHRHRRRAAEGRGRAC